MPVFQRLTSTQRSFDYIGPTLWNTLPVSITSIDSIGHFKRVLKEYFIDAYIQDDDET